ncbi:MAG: PrsW family intramembrane metalloprotease, partial [Dehalococcoidia bacterium]|nr:PrsW family intramembrane metalloprotease [Dehalococcoidia bacterium]
MNRRFYQQRWLQLLGGGVFLFAVTEQALLVTGNLNFVPTIMLLGAFVVPITFVAYFYEHVRDRDISMPLLTSCFFVGGIVGLTTAGILEYATLRSLSIPALFGIALIEESAKLLFPIGMYLAWRYRHEADGLLFGVAAGMGFAALETMGYGLVTLMQSQGDVSSLLQVLLIRGLLSPAGHAAWTGFVCAVLWRERERAQRPTLNLAVASAFALAVVLHALWNILSSLDTQSTLHFVVFMAGLSGITIVSLTVVIRRYLESRKSLG